MTKRISRSVAAAFYAAAFALCHEADFAKGRWLATDRSLEPLTTAFHIRTRFGSLWVHVNTEDFIPELGMEISMRFENPPQVMPPVAGELYNPHNGIWSFDDAGRTADDILAELAARLDWAQGRTPPPVEPAQQALTLG